MACSFALEISRIHSFLNIALKFINLYELCIFLGDVNLSVHKTCVFTLFVTAEFGSIFGKDSLCFSV